MLGDGMIRQLPQVTLDQREPAGVERRVVIDAHTIDIKEFLNRYAEPLPADPDGSFVLNPQSFALGVTRERIELPVRSKIAARVEGRSTLARLGLVVHMTAPTIQAGFRGRIVLEMYNFGNYPLRLQPGRLRICQLIFERVGRTPKGEIKTRHQGQRGVR